MTELDIKHAALKLIDEATRNWAYDDEKAFVSYVDGIMNLTEELLTIIFKSGTENVE